MATYALVTTGNLSGTIANQISGGSATIHASTNTSVPTGTDVFGATFTAPNTTDTSKGVFFYLADKSTSTSITITLQEDILGTATWLDTAAVAAINSSDLPLAVVGSTNTGRAYGQFVTPYVYATTGANRYRIKFRAAGAAIATAQAGSGGTIWYQAVDSRTATAGAADTCFLSGINGNTTPVVVTVDSNVSTFLGSNVALATPSNSRVDNCGLYIGIGGKLKASTSASAILTYNGPIIVDGDGEIEQDMSSAGSFESTFRIQAVSTQTQGIFICPNGKDKFKGDPFTQEIGYVSGLGTAASPIVLSAAVTGWKTGKEIYISATSNSATNYNEGEKRFILSFPSTTTMIVSATSGGAESALSFTHTTACDIVYAHANVIRDSVDTKTWKYSNGAIVAGYTVWDSFKTDLTGGNSLSNGIVLRATPFGGAITRITLGNGVFYRTGRGDPVIGGNLDASIASYPNLTSLYCTSAISHTSGNGFSITQSNVIIDNLYVGASQGVGISLSGASGVVLNNPTLNANAIGISGSVAINTGGSNNKIINAKINATRGYGLFFNNAEDIFFTNGGNGNNGINQSGNMLCGTTHNKVYFENMTVGSGTLIASYTLMLNGSEINFQKHNATDNYHFWFTPFGKAELTGLTGCPDATTSANGNPTLTITPESTSPGFIWNFQSLVRPNSSAFILLKNQKNVTYGTDVLTLDLYLPGSTVADKTVNAPNDTVENTLVLSQSYTGIVPLLASIEIVAKSVAVGAKTRISNIYNGTNDIINLKTWYRGKPATIQFEQLGDSQAVWQVPTATLTTSGTTGKYLTKILTLAKFIGLK